MKTTLAVVGGLFIGIGLGLGIAELYSDNPKSGPSSADLDQDYALDLDGKRYRFAELPTHVRALIFDAREDSYQKISNILNQFALQLALAKDQDSSIAIESLPPLEQLLGITATSDDELKKVFEANKSRLPANASFVEVKGEIERFVKTQKLADAIRIKSQEFKAQNRAKLMVQPPEPPLVDLRLELFPVQGPSQAANTLVEAADYLCPHCQQLQGDVEQLVTEAGARLRFAVINFSLKPEGLSGVLARGAICAQEQGVEAFFRYHAQAFKIASAKGWKATDGEKREALSLVGDAAQLDTKKLATCAEGARASELLQRNLDLLSKAGLTGTPTFYLNGRRLRHHAAPLKELVLPQLGS